MNLRPRRPPARPPGDSFARTALLDAANAAYADWHAESLAVEQLYTRWSEAERDERPLAHTAYAAALDREERAQVVYADLVRMAARYLRAA